MKNMARGCGQVGFLTWKPRIRFTNELTGSPAPSLASPNHKSTAKMGALCRQKKGLDHSSLTHLSDKPLSILSRTREKEQRDWVWYVIGAH